MSSTLLSRPLNKLLARNSFGLNDEGAERTIMGVVLSDSAFFQIEQ